MTKLFLCALASAPFLLGFPAAAEPAAVDKSAYHLFKPVPAEQLRELAGDRPDGTESPTTVDAGHIQLEMSLVDYSRDRDAGAETEVVTAGASNLRIGLLENLELQVIFDLYAREEVEVGASPAEVAEGFSDITLRPKLNLWGNEGGRTALAVMPALKIPTGTPLSNGEVEGGIIVPFGMDLTDRLGLGLMAEVDWVYDGDDGDHDTEFLHTAVLGYDLGERLGVYAEYIGIAGEGAYQPYLSGGLTFGVSDNAMFDVGAVVGLNDEANDLQVFTGFTVRF